MPQSFSSAPGTKKPTIPTCWSESAPLKKPELLNHLHLEDKPIPNPYRFFTAFLHALGTVEAGWRKTDTNSHQKGGETK